MTDQDRLEMGRRIKFARELKNISLEYIATEIGVARSTIQRYETGKIQKPKLPVVMAIADALQVDPAWLVLKTDVMIHPSISEPSRLPLDSLRPDEQSLLSNYNQLNKVGKDKLLEDSEDLLQLPKYTKDIGLRAGQKT